MAIIESWLTQRPEADEAEANVMYRLMLLKMMPGANPKNCLTKRSSKVKNYDCRHVAGGLYWTSKH